MNLLDSKRKKTYVLFFSFAIPALILLLVFMHYGFAPFGDGSKSLLAMDMAGQYSQFYKGLKNFSDQGSVFFSWSKALGTNYVGVFAYYLASPLSWLTLLCPNEHMASGILFLTVLKVGLCGLTFALYLRSRGLKCHVCVLFSTFYALMSYNLVYLMCLMWIDAVIWLPLILLLIDRLITTGKWGLLTASYAVLFISTYYMAYMCGIFSACYFLYRLFTEKDSALKLKAVKSGKFLFSVISAIGLGAWLLIPTVSSLFEGKLGGESSLLATFFKQSKEAPFAFDSKDMLIKFFNGVYDSITNNGMPFFYCGVVVMVMFLGFFFVKSIKMQKKLLLIAITAFFISSFYLTFLNYAWHVFQKPNWFPFRFSFLFFFVIIYAAAVAFDRIKDIPWHFFVAAIAVFTMICLIALKSTNPSIQTEDINITLALFTVCALLMLLMNYKKKAIVYIVCFVTICVTSTYDISRHANAMFEGIDGAHFYESSEQHKKYYVAMEQMIEAAEKDSGGRLFRVGQSAFQSFNEPIGLGYSSISHYSSAFDADVNYMLSDLGYGDYYYWVAPFGGSLVTDMILSTKYIIVPDSAGSQFPDIKVLEFNNIPQKQYETVISQDGFTLYRNQYALPIAFSANAEIMDYRLSSDFVVNQNKLLNAMTGSHNVYLSPVDYDCVKDGYTYTYTIEATCDGVLYATIPNNGYPRSDATVNDKYFCRLYSAELDCLIYMGYYHQGDEIKVSLSNSNKNFDPDQNDFYMFNVHTFSQEAARLAQGGMHVNKWSEGFIEGTVTNDIDQVIFTSIPYDDGWHITVDGKAVQTRSAAGFMAFEADSGEHFVTMKYYAPGQQAGLCISIVTVVVLYAIYNFKKVRRCK